MITKRGSGSPGQFGGAACIAAMSRFRLPVDGVPEMTPITLGIEEELLIVDPASGDVIADPDPSIFAECQRSSGPHRVVNELLRSQIETNSRICSSVAELGASLEETRGIVIDVTRRHGAAVIASSLHPWARWQSQQVTPKRRYQEAEITFQQSVRQFFVGGMHIHAGFGDPELRIRVMTALRQYLPVLLAVSTSSPFYAGQLTGLKSYRQIVIAALPRTGMPRALRSQAEFDEIVERYRSIRAIEDASEIRWDIRPSSHYPTIELRICDICPRIEDATALAALYACLIRFLARKITAGEKLPELSHELIEEGRWLAQRFGTLAFLPRGDPPALFDVEDCLTDLVEEVREDARALDCEGEIEHLGGIIREGSSADRQEDVYRQAMLDGADEGEALRRVVDSIIAETEGGAARESSRDGR